MQEPSQQQTPPRCTKVQRLQQQITAQELQHQPQQSPKKIPSPEQQQTMQAQIPQKPLKARRLLFGQKEDFCQQSNNQDIPSQPQTTQQTSVYHNTLQEQEKKIPGTVPHQMESSSQKQSLQQTLKPDAKEKRKYKKKKC